MSILTLDPDPNQINLSDPQVVVDEVYQTNIPEAEKTFLDRVYDYKTRLNTAEEREENSKVINFQLKTGKSFYILLSDILPVWGISRNILRSIEANSQELDEDGRILVSVQNSDENESNEAMELIIKMTILLTNPPLKPLSDDVIRKVLDLMDYLHTPKHLRIKLNKHVVYLLHKHYRPCIGSKDKTRFESYTRAGPRVRKNVAQICWNWDKNSLTRWLNWLIYGIEINPTILWLAEIGAARKIYHAPNLYNLISIRNMEDDDYDASAFLSKPITNICIVIKTLEGLFVNEDDFALSGDEVRAITEIHRILTTTPLILKGEMLNLKDCDEIDVKKQKTSPAPTRKFGSPPPVPRKKKWADYDFKDMPNVYSSPLPSPYSSPLPSPRSRSPSYSPPIRRRSGRSLPPTPIRRGSGRQLPPIPTRGGRQPIRGGGTNRTLNFPPPQSLPPPNFSNSPPLPSIPPESDDEFD